MANSVAFHTQLASIMEVLANAAVAEICELVDNGYAVLHSEISRGQKENEALRRKLRLMEMKVSSASALREGMGNSVLPHSRAHLGMESKRTSNSTFTGYNNSFTFIGYIIVETSGFKTALIKSIVSGCMLFPSTHFRRGTMSESN